MNDVILERAREEGLEEPAWEMALLFPGQGHWGEEEYLLLPTNRHVELADGRIEVLPMPTRLHQRIVMHLLALVQGALERLGGGEVIVAPYPVKLWAGRFREPDLVVAAPGQEHRFTDRHAEGADLVVEVVSPGDPGRDRHLKRDEYARAGIAEYWIVDPLQRTITVLTLVDGVYVGAVHAPGAVATSTVLPGLSVAVREALQP